jgi:GntR family transcriptional regulator
VPVIEFYLNRRSGVATYLQLVQQVEQALRLGTLRPGDQLPTAKDVVNQLAINPNTVLKAYRELERANLVEARAGVGTFIRTGARLSVVTDHPELRAQLAGWMAAASLAGLGPDDVHALYTAELRAAFPTTAGSAGREEVA